MGTSKSKLQEIKERVLFLNNAAKAYYRDNEELIPNLTYDRLYDELESLERQTGIILANSPTQKVGYETLDSLPKEAHSSRMLSLDKTKSIEDLRSWLADKTGLLSWKLDGLTIVLTYRNGLLFKAVTRGNGEIGEVITGNAKVFANIPVRIPFKGQLVLRGEAIITYSSFKKINEEIPELEAKYKNPRNLCSGSVRQLNNRITAERDVHFIGFSLVEAEGETFEYRHEQLEWLSEQGFEVVEFHPVTGGTLKKTVQLFESEIAGNDMIFISAMILRKRIPAEQIKFKIPGGYAFLCLLCIVPIFIGICSFFINGTEYFIGGMIGIVSGPVLYFIWKRRYGGLAKKDPEAHPLNPRTRLGIGDTRRMSFNFLVIAIMGFIGKPWLYWFEGSDYFGAKDGYYSDTYPTGILHTLFGNWYHMLTAIQISAYVFLAIAIVLYLVSRSVEPKKLKTKA